MGKGSPKGTSPSGKELQPTCYAFEVDECPKRNLLVIVGIRLSAPLSNKEAANLGIGVRFKHTEQGGGEQKERHISVAVAKTLDITSAGKEVVKKVQSISRCATFC